MKVEEIKFFSERTKKFYKLIPTSTWPTLEISGIHMHRIKNIDPRTDSELKLKALGKIKGIGLDCCTGLGYTAILASRKRKVNRIITIEKDENVLRVARQNPFSRELFSSDKINLILGDSFLLVPVFSSSCFDFIIHDPPRISIAPELYSFKFYEQLFRILKKGGKMFHYVGEPGVKQGKNYLRGIVSRLMKAGFKRVRKVEPAKGLVCFKF